MSATPSNTLNVNSSVTNSNSGSVTIDGTTFSSSRVTLSNSSGTYSNSSSVTINGTTFSSSRVTLSNSSGTVYTSYTPKITLNVLGEDYEIETMYSDLHLANAMATLNVLGEPYWIELKKQGITFDSDLENFIEEKLKARRRQDSIDKIVGTNSRT